MQGTDVSRKGGRRLAVGAAVGLTVTTALLVGTVFAGTAAASHVACGQVINSDTRLDSDLSCPGTGVIIGADNVTLDLNGHTLSGDPNARAAAGEDAAGVVFRMVSGSTVRDGTIRDFDAGIVIRGGSGNAVRNVAVRDNINYRILTGVNASPNGPGREDDPPPCDFGDGIAVFNSGDNRIERSQIINNGPFSGISLVEDSDGNRVFRNVISDNDVLNLPPGAQPRQGMETVCGTGGDQGPMTRGRTMQDSGVRIEGPGADDNRVSHNELTGNGLTGIAIHGYVCSPPTGPDGQPRFPAGENNGGNLVFQNTVSNTGSGGVDPVADGIATLQQGPANIVCVAHSNTIKNNVSSNNDRHGIFLGGRGSHDNTVINNRVNDNAGSGLFVSGPSINQTTGEQVTPGAIDNKLLANKGTGNGKGFNAQGEPNGYDGFDGNADCDNNMWRGSKFDRVNRPCVWGPGGAKGSGGAKPGKGEGAAKRR